MATRARRANAGSRLKQLIELEEQSSELQNLNQFVTEDDENVNLLFQEDENDEEFFDEEVDNENLRGIDEDEEESEAESLDGKTKRAREESDNDEETNVNSDEQLSDSEISASDDDESEGEKELERQEKLKKRKLKSRHSLVPTIKKVPVKGPAVKKAKKAVLPSAETLLMLERRSSSRAAAVENKKALLKRLKENEKKKAAQTPVVRIQYKEMTQEERLAEAIETEKSNIESLNRFREQEVVKKEKQRQLLLLKRAKLKNVIRFRSEETYITPNEEIREARIRHELLHRKKKKPGRKKKIENQEPPVKIRVPGAIDEELPLVKLEMERQRIEDQDVKQEDVEDASAIATENQDGQVKSEETKVDAEHDETEIKNAEDSEGIVVEPSETVDEEIVENQKTEEDSQQPEMSVEGEEDKPHEKEIEQTDDQTNIETSKETEEAQSVEPGEVDNEIEVKTEEDKPIKSDADEKTTKKVKFVDELVEEEEGETPNVESREETPATEVEDEGEIFEGPPQRVGRNFVYLLEFEEDNKDLRLIQPNIKSVLFGPQSLLPASRRFKDLKTILRIGKVDNPYAAVKQERDILFEPASELTEDDPVFEELKKLPRLGVKQAMIEEVEENIEEESAAIVLKTEAPTGIYLPNGNKKNCLISGTEVKYFDPSTGIPYSSVETYKFLKLIEQGQVPWYSLSGDQNDTGPVEVYLGSRDGSVRAAKGVPEGFEG